MYDEHTCPFHMAVSPHPGLWFMFNWYILIELRIDMLQWAFSVKKTDAILHPHLLITAIFLEFPQWWPLWRSSTVYLNLVCEQVPGVNGKKIGGRSSLRVVTQNWATSEASRRGRKRRIRKVNKEVISMPIVRHNRLDYKKLRQNVS